jgi:hypothetical protein
MFGGVRRGRRLGGAAAAAFCVALAASEGAAAEGYFISSSVGDASARTFAQVYGTVDEVSGRLRLRVVRDEEEVENHVGDFTAYQFSPGTGSSNAVTPVELLSGDRVELYVPIWATIPTKVIVWDARPTLETCEIGSWAVGGRAHPAGMRLLYASVHHPAASPYSFPMSESASVVQGGVRWTGTFRQPIGPGDKVSMDAIFEPEPNMSISRSEHAKAGECRPPADSPAFKVFGGHDGLLSRLKRADMRQRSTTVRVRVACVAQSATQCRGRLNMDTVKRFATASAKRKKVALSAAKLDLAPGRSAWVRLKIRAAGKRLLHRRKKLEAAVTATTRDPSGRRLATSRALTLKGVRRR